MGLRIAIPPQTLGLYRDVFMTITLFGLKQCSAMVKNIVTGLDESRGLEYVEIDSDKVDALAKCIASQYSILGVGSAKDLQQLLYDTWQYYFDPTSASYKLYMGGSAFVKHDMVEHVKFFYARDLKTVINRSESVSRGKVRPLAGFLDLGFDKARGSRVLWYFDRYRGLDVTIQQLRAKVYVTASHIPSMYTTYASVLENFVKMRKIARGHMLVISEECSSFLRTRLAMEEPDLMARWFELYTLEQVLRMGVSDTELYQMPPIRVYVVDAGNPKIMHSFVELSMGTIIEIRMGLELSAQKFGTTGSKLARCLREALEHIAQASSSPRDEVSRAASALKTRLRILINSAIEGNANPESMYALAREAMLYSDLDPIFARVGKALTRLST